MPTTMHRSTVAAATGADATIGVDVEVDVTYAEVSIELKSLRRGNHVVVHVRGKYPRSYVTGTHGHSAESFAAEVRELTQRHMQCEKRIDELQQLAGMEWAVGGVNYKLSDITIGVSGKADFELYIQIVQKSQSQPQSEWSRFAVIRSVYGTLAGIPSNDDITALMRERTRPAAPASSATDVTFSSAVHLLLSSAAARSATAPSATPPAVAAGGM